ncbi:hypothetical protein SLEP1_g22742 [Rubroshorea leprosula]|uniref:Uncharacterized protein n=1 Tax=Rubroshorea leprosula TaxID=152421 RepID=A0AAV5JM58_9ROSI|nr:hypothetical protein SLEP1_g22742 [Rubroshorea leprosula]
MPPLRPSAAPDPLPFARPCFLHQPCSAPQSHALAFCTLQPYRQKQNWHHW